MVATSDPVLLGLVGAVVLLAVIAYGVLGGADFGGGVWDLFASGSREDVLAQRHAIAQAMGPVWEANHVWLIFVIVLLFSAFPPAFSALSIALFVPFHLALVGITLRGAAFVFRGYGPRRTFGPMGVVFGAASVVTPVLLGMCLGAVSTGEIRVEHGVVRGASAWLHPLPLLMGALALGLCSYLAAVFLIVETEGPLREQFRRRAFGAGTVVVALSVLALPLLRLRAPHLWEGLLSARALPVLGVGAVAALTSGGALLLRRPRLSRAAAVAQVSCLLAGWGLAQAPYLIYPDVTLGDAAAPPAMLRLLLWTLPFGAALLLPSLWFLFRVFKRERT